jgi:hypothetical protein
VTGRQLLTGLFGKSNFKWPVVRQKVQRREHLVADGKDGGVNLAANLA